MGSRERHVDFSCRIPCHYVNGPLDLWGWVDPILDEVELEGAWFGSINIKQSLCPETIRHFKRLLRGMVIHDD